MRKQIFQCSVLGFFFSVFCSLSLQARMILPSKEVPFDKWSAQSQIVFKGVCESKEEDWVYHPKTKAKIPVAVYHFKITEALKGEIKAGEIFDVKQLGVKTRREAIQLGVWGMEGRRFETGKRYHLFLGTPNALGIHPILGDVYEK